MPIPPRPAALASRVALLVWAITPTFAAAQAVDTGPAAAPSALSPLWLGEAFNRGQSFTVGPTQTILTSFGFHLSSLTAFETQSYRAFVARWDPATQRTVGPLLWQSAPVAGVASGTATLVTYAVPALALSPGGIYIAMLSDAGLYPSGGNFPLGGAHLALGRDSYAGGEGYSLFANLADPSQLTMHTWTSFGDLATPGGYIAGEDFAFQATLVARPVFSPEPVTWALVGSGLVVLSTVVRRRAAR